MVKDYFLARVLFIIFIGILGLIFFRGLFQNLNPVQFENLAPIIKSHSLEVYAWYPDWDEKDALVSLETAKISQVSPFWYKLNKEGKIEALKTKNKADILEVSKKRQIKIIPSITNEFDKERVTKLLDDREAWGEVVAFLIFEAEANKYDGYDLDWEELAASDKDNFSEFVKFMSDSFRAKDLKFSVTVHAQNGNENQRGALQAQDLKVIIENVDELRIMAYDFHHANSSAGPVTPLSDLDQVLNYAKNNFPANKVVIALPTYGYDWSPKKGEPLQYDEMLKKLNIRKAEYSLNTTEQALEATYKASDGQHQVWFENSQTVKAKVEKVKSAGFYKVIFWRLGGEDSEIWKSL